MKKSELRTIVRKVVREEVALAIQEVITELKQPVVEEQPQIQQPKKRKVIKEKKQYTSNSVLNDVLNETANDDSEWETLGGTGKVHTTQDTPSLIRGKYSSMMGDNPNGTLAAEMGVNPNNAPDFLTKDYRAVMNAINNKK